MEIAHLVATRATCPRRSVGAVLVKERRILATGYNGAPRGIAHCPDEGQGQFNEWPSGCLKAGHCIRALHAEQNALLSAAMIGTPCAGATIYVTCQPCNMCAKMLINAGIESIIYEGDYPDQISLDLFTEAGMLLNRYVNGSLEKVV